jgi:Cu-Zn family superoxide dismutase
MTSLVHQVRLIGCLSAILMMAVNCGGTQKSEAMPAASESSIPPALPPTQPVTSSTTAPEPVASAKPAEPTQDFGSPATVTIEAKSGSKLKGTAQFEPSAAGIKITVEVTDAPPGPHGAHIHEKPDCSDKEAKNAGDHFNPTTHEHGLPPAEMRHLGDLGNLEVGKDGKGHLEITIAGANMRRGDKLSFLDRAIVIHEKVDNGGQPAGNAGKRIGCGEIK